MDYEWKKCESYLSQPPLDRWGATLTPIGYKLYLIGGIVCYNLSKQSWEVTETYVPSRSGHVAAALFDKYILIHGGCYIEKDNKHNILGDFICIDASTNQLKMVKVNLKNDIIGKLCYHSWCVDYGEKNNPIIYMFGGKNKDGLSNRFFKLSIELLHNHSAISIDSCELELPKLSPLPRIFHTLNFYDGHHINLIGGCSLDYKEIYNDSWTYNTKKNKWEKEEEDDDDDEVKHGKSGHTVECISKKTLYIFGGMYSNYETVNTLEVKSFSNKDDDDDDENNYKLNLLKLRPGNRRGHSSCHISKVMFIFGGFNGSSFYNDLYMFGKKSDIMDLEEEVLNCEMINYCDENIDNVHIPNSWKKDNNDDKSGVYYYDSRLISYYPFVYEVAERIGYDDLNTITDKLGKMIDNTEDPDNEINPNSFSNYLDSDNSKQPSKFEELQRRVREQIEKLAQTVVHKTLFPCKICNKQVITHVLIPCGCFCVCEKCAKSLAGKNCPSCKAMVESSVTLYVG